MCVCECVSLFSPPPPPPPPLLLVGWGGQWVTLDWDWERPSSPTAMAPLERVWSITSITSMARLMDPVMSSPAC